MIYGNSRNRILKCAHKIGDSVTISEVYYTIRSIFSKRKKFTANDSILKLDII